MSGDNPLSLQIGDINLFRIANDCVTVGGQNPFAKLGIGDGENECFIQKILGELAQSFVESIGQAKSTTNNAMQSFSNNMSAFWLNFTAAIQGSKSATA